MKNSEIGKRIQQRRKALNISVVDVASYTGLSKATIHRYENGDIKDIKLPTIDAISSILDVNPAWLIGKSENMERRRGKTTNLIHSLDHFINYIKNTNYLTVGSRQVTENEKCMLIKILQLAKDILDNNKGE